MVEVLVRWVEGENLRRHIMQHPLDVSYAGISGWYILLALGLVSIGFFTFRLQKATRLVMVGAKDDRFDSWGARLKETASVWLGQKEGSGRPNCGWNACLDVLGIPNAFNRYV